MSPNCPFAQLVPLVPNWPSELPLASNMKTTLGAVLARPVDWTRYTVPWALMATNGEYQAAWSGTVTVRIQFPLASNSM